MTYPWSSGSLWPTWGLRHSPLAINQLLKAVQTPAQLQAAVQGPTRDQGTCNLAHAFSPGPTAALGSGRADRGSAVGSKHRPTPPRRDAPAPGAPRPVTRTWRLSWSPLTPLTTKAIWLPLLQRTQTVPLKITTLCLVLLRICSVFMPINISGRAA